MTVFSSFYSAKNILVDVTLVAEYSTDIKRKLEFSCIIEDRSKRGIRNYTLRVNSRHPATKYENRFICRYIYFVFHLNQKIIIVDLN